MSLFRMVVTMSHSSLGGTGTNTWHMRTLGDPVDLGEANILVHIVEDMYDDRVTSFPAGAVIRFDGTLVGVGPDEGTFLEADNWTVTGTGSGDVLPPANCIAVTWSGATGDRSKIGRNFFGPLVENVNDTNGTIEGASLTAWRAAAATLVAASTGFPNGAIGVWSRQEDLFRDYVNSSISDRFAVLRSRRD